MWYVLEGQERNVYCYQDKEVQLLDSVNNKAFGEPGYVLFFNEGESAAVYGNSYNKVVIKDGSGEPWEVSLTEHFRFPALWKMSTDGSFIALQEKLRKCPCIVSARTGRRLCLKKM